MIRVSCPKCKAILQVEDKHAGQVIICSDCKTSLRLPQAPAPPLSRPVVAASSTPASSPPAPVTEWHFIKNGQQQGPVTAEQLRGLIAPADLVWKEGLPQWVPASTVPNLLPSRAAPPVPPPSPKEIGGTKPTPSLGFLDNLTQKLTEKIKDTLQSVPGPQQQQATPAPPSLLPGQDWLYTTDGKQKCGPVSFDQLQKLAEAGHLQPSSMVRREGMDKWMPAGQFKALWPGKEVATRPASTTQPTSQHPAPGQGKGYFFHDLGEYIPEEYTKCRELLAQAGISEADLVFFGGTRTRQKAGIGKSLMNLLAKKEQEQPVIHLALTRRELAVVYAGEGAAPVTKASYEMLSWSFATAEAKGTGIFGGAMNLMKPKEGVTSEVVKTEILTLAMPSGERKLDLHEGKGLEALKQLLGQMCHERAKVWHAEGKYFLAEKLLSKISLNFKGMAEVERLQEQIGTVAEAQVSYQGGHPDFVEKAKGILRLDSLGLEFVPADEQQNYMRVSYEKVVDILEPRQGEYSSEMIQHVEDMKKSAAAKEASARQTGKFMAQHGHADAGNFLATRGVSSAREQRADAKLGPLPKNRLCAIVVHEGVKHKVLFDVVGGLRENIEGQAGSFWNRSAKVRGRFHKPSTPAPIRATSSKTSPALPTAALAQLQELLNQGILTQKEFDQKKALLQGTATVDLKPIIVGCPKCQGKIRAKKPGIIQCPKCMTKIRVDKSRFEQ